MDGVCKKGALSKAFNLFQKMHSLAVLPNTVTYTALINGLCKQGAIRKALQLLDCMASKGLCKKGLLENLQYIIYKGHKPNFVTYTVVMDALCKKEEIEKAEELVEDMISRGVQPNVVTYSTLIDGLCKMNKLENAMNWLDMMVSKDLPPNIVTYNIIMDVLCKKGETVKVEELLDYIISRGVQPDIVTYNTLIDGLCKKKELKNAKKFLREMVDKGISPDIVTCSIIIDAFCTTGDVINILVNVVLNHGAQKYSTYISLIKAYVKRRKIEEAKCVLKRMNEKELNPNLDAYVPIQEMLVQMGRVDDAKYLTPQTIGKADDWVC